MRAGKTEGREQRSESRDQRSEVGVQGWMPRRTFCQAALAVAAASIVTRSASEGRFTACAAEADTVNLRPEALGEDYAFPKVPRARLSFTLDLEMSTQYPKPGLTEWNYAKGNLVEATTRY